MSALIVTYRWAKIRVASMRVLNSAATAHRFFRGVRQFRRSSEGGVDCGARAKTGAPLKTELLAPRFRLSGPKVGPRPWQ